MAAVAAAYLCASLALEDAPEIDLSNLIPGIAIGIRGMRCREVRELFLHPDRCYGMFSDFVHGGAVYVKISLINVTPTQADIPNESWIGLEKWRSDSDVCLESYSYQCGVQVGTHYRKVMQGVDPADLIEMAKQEDFLPLSEDECRQLQLIEWEIYRRCFDEC